MAQARLEQEIFGELGTLCTSPGFIHALALLCFRDNFVLYRDTVTAEDFRHLSSPEALIRNELSTLLGLLVQKPISYEQSSFDVISGYITRAEALLKELHDGMSIHPSDYIKVEDGVPRIDSAVDPFFSGKGLREPIFYGPDPAYNFQYRDLTVPKYLKDDEWIRARKGFSIVEAVKVLTATGDLLTERVTERFHSLRSTKSEQFTILPGFTFNSSEVASRAGLSVLTTTSILDAFSISDTNPTFQAVSDFNAVNALPIIKTERGDYVLLQHYSLAEAMYESPFFWMAADKNYAPQLQKNRGEFTELTALGFLRRVFPNRCVYRDVLVTDDKGNHVSDIDCLVVFGDVAIVLQAKSKRLTIEARKGNDQSIKSDFGLAVKAAYDQALLCAQALLSADKKLTVDGKPLVFGESPKKVFPLCVVSDHYPALAFQARQFLAPTITDEIFAPLVIDVFALDAISEMLSSPLRFISYLHRRALLSDRLLATHEHTLLSYHLKKNLWVADDVTMVWLQDDIATDLNIAMLARREGYPGRREPDGILTRYRGTSAGKLIEQVEAAPNSAAIDLGLYLLQLSEKSLDFLSNGIEHITAAARRDRENHDFSMQTGGGKKSGITVHCNTREDKEAHDRLRAHCEMRKYASGGDTWYGVVLDVAQQIRTAGKLSYPWEENLAMAEAVRRFTKPPAVDLKQQFKLAKKIGRNEPCPCGSGRKYKRCCLREV